MFKVEFMVDDKHLGEAFKRLAGIAHEIEHHYIPNVVPAENGKVRVTASTSVELISQELKKLGGTVDAHKMREAVSAAGFSPTSYSHFLHMMMQKKVLKKVIGDSNQATTYAWIK